LTVDDGTLILRFQKGDKLALDTLIARHEALAYQYAYRLTRDPDQACDIVSEAFVRIYKSLGSFRGNSAFTTWLYRIITNCFLDTRRQSASRPTVSLENALLTGEGEINSHIMASFLSPQAEFERGELRTRLSQAIAKLPVSYRTIIVLFHAEMLSYKEITLSLHLPLGTVKSRLNRARLALRDLLEDQRESLLAA